MCKIKEWVFVILNYDILFRHDVYNRLGSITLNQDTTAWPNVRKFLNQISSQYQNALVADVGCGTGKYIQLKSDLFTIGCDRSRQLCEIAREKYSHIPILIADNLHLPYRDNLFDAVLSIGVIHHLATHERRLQAIRGGFWFVNCFE
jgi:ubiquinone/menaquinone biosynthesis C-methylase UbiE